MASFSMFGSLGAAVQVVLILYPLHLVHLWVCEHTHVHSSEIGPLTDSLIIDLVMMLITAVTCHIRALRKAHLISVCCFLFLSIALLSSVVLNDDFSYLMVSSVVGFYSSPLFTGMLPRAKDTNLTQVSNSYPLHIFYKIQRCSVLTSFDFFHFFFSDHCKLRVTAYPKLGTASLFTHTW